MFSYYGSKSEIAHLYPKPVHKVIIEPFAGSAGYSMLYNDHEVKLYDTSEYVVRVWQYLLNAKPKDILALPDVPSKVSLNTIDGLDTAERYLIGFCLCRGKAVPRHTGHGQNSWAKDKVRIAESLVFIRHWTIEQKSYDEIKNRNATWFIDPPYKQIQDLKNHSDKYIGDPLDYKALAEWVKERKGQVMACEGGTVRYLPFKKLGEFNTNTNNTTAKKAIELVYAR